MDTTGDEVEQPTAEDTRRRLAELATGGEEWYRGMPEAVRQVTYDELSRVVAYREAIEERLAPLRAMALVFSLTEREILEGINVAGSIVVQAVDGDDHDSLIIPMRWLRNVDAERKEQLG